MLPFIPHISLEKKKKIRGVSPKAAGWISTEYTSTMSMMPHKKPENVQIKLLLNGVLGLPSSIVSEKISFNSSTIARGINQIKRAIREYGIMDK